MKSTPLGFRIKLINVGLWLKIYRAALANVYEGISFKIVLSKQKIL